MTRDRVVTVLLICLFVTTESVRAQFGGPNGEAEEGKAKLIEIEGLKRLAPDANAWVDMKRKYVVFDGLISMRAGPLEMFVCTRGTKEHESVISAGCPAFIVHAGLLAVGAKQGNTVKWDPEYVPASGTEIDIWILWKDREGKHRQIRAQEWIRDLKTGKPMAHHWVFAGSGFWKDDQTGEEHYMAEGGDFICVSNFSSATLDLPIRSSQETSGLLFEAVKERIPVRGTHVRVVLIPKLEKPMKDTQASPKPQPSTQSPGESDAP